MSRNVTLVIAAACVGWFACGALAQPLVDANWEGAIDSAWSKTGNWTPAAIPGVNSVARFQAGKLLTVDLGAGVGLANRADLEAGGYTIRNGTLSLAAGLRNLLGENTISANVAGSDLSIAVSSGKLTLSGANNAITGDSTATVAAGATLEVVGSTSLGSSAVRLEGGTLRIVDPADLLPAAGSVVAHYTFDDAANLGADSSANGYDATVFNNPVAAGTAHVGGAIFWDSTQSQYMQLPDINPAFSGSTGQTLVMWLKREAADLHVQGTSGILSLGSGSNNHYTWDNKTAYFNTFRNARQDTIPVLSDAEQQVWHMVTIVNDTTANQWAVYYNDNTTPVRTATTTAFSLGSSRYVGRNEGTQYWRGSMDEFILWNTALTPAEIQAMYAYTGPLVPDLSASAITAAAGLSSDIEISSASGATAVPTGVVALETGATLNVTGGIVNAAGVTMAAGSSLNAAVGLTGPTLTLPADAGVTLAGTTSFGSVTAPGDAGRTTTITVATGGETTFAGFSDEAKAISLVKAGEGMIVLSGMLPSQMDDTTVRIEAGTVRVVQGDAGVGIGGAAVLMAGGTLEIPAAVPDPADLIATTGWDTSGVDVDGRVGPGVVTTSSTDLSGEDVYDLFDDLIGAQQRKWYNNAPAPVWVQYQYDDGKKYVVREMSLWMGNDTPNRDFRDWNLQGSNDGVTFDTLLEVTDSVQLARNAEARWEVDNLIGYNMYRVNILSTWASGNNPQANEIEFWGVEGEFISSHIGTNVTAVSDTDSTITVGGAAPIGMGSLTMQPRSALTVGPTGWTSVSLAEDTTLRIGGAFSAESVTFTGPAGATYTLDIAAGVTLAPPSLTDSGSAMTLVKAGDGALDLTGSGHAMGSSTVRIVAGQVEVTGGPTPPEGSLAQADYDLAGGTLFVQGTFVNGLKPTSIDIGSALPGSYVEADEFVGVHTIQADGVDIQSTADGFRFTYVPLSGDTATEYPDGLIARVESLSLTNAWAKAGIMIRETLAASSRNVILETTPPDGQNVASLQWRLQPGGGTGYTTIANRSLPYWIKMERAGDQISSYISTDGVLWEQYGTVTAPMAQDVYVGLAVTSHATGALTTAVFDNVNFLGVRTALADLTDSNVVVTGASIIDGDTSIAFNRLTMGSGAALTVLPSRPDRYVQFVGGTTFAGDANFAPVGELRLGAIGGTPGAITLEPGSTGTVTLSDTATGSALNGATLVLQGGTLAAVYDGAASSIGDANVTLDGGTLRLTNTAGGTAPLGNLLTVLNRSTLDVGGSVALGDMAFHDDANLVLVGAGTVTIPKLTAVPAPGEMADAYLDVAGSVDLRVSRIDEGPEGVSISKLGEGRVILDTADGGSTVGALSLMYVSSGTAVFLVKEVDGNSTTGLDDLGLLAIQQGGRLGIVSADGKDIRWPISPQMWGSGTIYVGRAGEIGHPDPVTVTISGQDILFPLAIPGGEVLTLEVDAGYTLRILGDGFSASLVEIGLNGMLVKTGEGLAALVDGTAHTGSTTVQAGTLQVEGGLATTSGIVVTGGTLDANGPVDLVSGLPFPGDVTVSGGTMYARSTFAAGNLVVGPDGTVDLAGDASLTAGITVTGGLATAHLSTTALSLDVSGGRYIATGALDAADISVSGGRLDADDDVIATAITISGGTYNQPNTSLLVSSMVLTGGQANLGMDLDADTLRIIGGRLNIDGKITVGTAFELNAGGGLFVTDPDALAGVGTEIDVGGDLDPNASWLGIGQALSATDRPLITVHAGSALTGALSGSVFQDADGYATSPAPGVNVVLYDGAYFGGDVAPTTGDLGAARLYRALVGGTVEAGKTIILGDDSTTTADIYRTEAAFGPWTAGRFQGTLVEGDAVAGQGLTINVFGQSVELDANARFTTATDANGVNFIGAGKLTLVESPNTTGWKTLSRTGTDATVNDDTLVLGSGAAASGKDLKVSQGHVVLLADDSVAAGATLSLLDGSMMKLSTVAPGSGTIHVGAGGAVWLDAPGRLAGGANWSFANGSLLIHRGDGFDPTAENWPTGATFIADSEEPDTFATPLLLSDGAYLGTSRDSSALIAAGSGVQAAPGFAVGQAVGIVAAPGRAYDIEGSFDLGFDDGGTMRYGKLIVGSTVPMGTVVGNGNADRVTTLMTGTVGVAGPFHVGEVEVRSGILDTYDAGALDWKSGNITIGGAGVDANHAPILWFRHDTGGSPVSIDGAITVSNYGLLATHPDAPGVSAQLVAGTLADNIVVEDGGSLLLWLSDMARGGYAEQVIQYLIYRRGELPGGNGDPNNGELAGYTGLVVNQKVTINGGPAPIEDIYSGIEEATALNTWRKGLNLSVVRADLGVVYLPNVHLGEGAMLAVNNNVVQYEVSRNIGTYVGLTLDGNAGTTNTVGTDSVNFRIINIRSSGGPRTLTVGEVGLDTMTHNVYGQVGDGAGDVTVRIVNGGVNLYDMNLDGNYSGVAPGTQFILAGGQAGATLTTFYAQEPIDEVEGPFYVNNLRIRAEDDGDPATRDGVLNTEGFHNAGGDPWAVVLYQNVELGEGARFGTNEFAARPVVNLKLDGNAIFENASGTGGWASCYINDVTGNGGVLTIATTAEMQLIGHIANSDLRIASSNLVRLTSADWLDLPNYIPGATAAYGLDRFTMGAGGTIHVEPTADGDAGRTIFYEGRDGVWGAWADDVTLRVGVAGQGAKAVEFQANDANGTAVVNTFPGTFVAVQDGTARLGSRKGLDLGDLPGRIVVPNVVLESGSTLTLAPADGVAIEVGGELAGDGSIRGVAGDLESIGNFTGAHTLTIVGDSIPVVGHVDVTGLSVRMAGGAFLSLVDGAQLTADSVTLNSPSSAGIDLQAGSTVNIGTFHYLSGLVLYADGATVNIGTVSIDADADLRGAVVPIDNGVANAVVQINESLLGAQNWRVAVGGELQTDGPVDGISSFALDGGTLRVALDGNATVGRPANVSVLQSSTLWAGRQTVLGETGRILTFGSLVLGDAALALQAGHDYHVTFLTTEVGSASAAVDLSVGDGSARFGEVEFQGGTDALLVRAHGGTARFGGLTGQAGTKLTIDGGMVMLSDCLPGNWLGTVEIKNGNLRLERELNGYDAATTLIDGVLEVAFEGAANLGGYSARDLKLSSSMAGMIGPKGYPGPGLALTGRLIVNVPEVDATFRQTDGADGNQPLLLGAGAEMTSQVAGAKFSAPLDVAGQAVLTGDVDYEIAGLIGGAGGLVKTGNAAVTLSHANTMGGGVTIQAGTLVMANATAFGNNENVAIQGGTLKAAVNGVRFSTGMSPDYTLTIGAAGTLEIAAIDANLAGVIVGAGTLKLSSPMTGSTAPTAAITGTTLINNAGIDAAFELGLSGTIRSDINATVGAFRDLANTTFAVAAGKKLTFAGDRALVGDWTWDISAGGTVEFAGDLTGQRNLTKAGMGTLVLNGAGNDINVLTIGTSPGGTVVIGSAAAEPNAVIIKAGGLYTVDSLGHDYSEVKAADSAGIVALSKTTNTTLIFTGSQTLSLGAYKNSSFGGVIEPGANGFLFGGGPATLNVTSWLAAGQDAQFGWPDGGANAAQPEGLVIIAEETLLNQDVRVHMSVRYGNADPFKDANVYVHPGGAIDFANNTGNLANIHMSGGSVSNVNGSLAKAQIDALFGSGDYRLGSNFAGSTTVPTGALTRADAGLTKEGTNDVRIEGAQTYATAGARLTQVLGGSLTVLSPATGLGGTTNLDIRPGAAVNFNGAGTFPGKVTLAGTLNANDNLTVQPASGDSLVLDAATVRIGTAAGKTATFGRTTDKDIDVVLIKSGDGKLILGDTSGNSKLGHTTIRVEGGTLRAGYATATDKQSLGGSAIVLDGVGATLSLATKFFTYNGLAASRWTGSQGTGAVVIGGSAYVDNMDGWTFTSTSPTAGRLTDAPLERSVETGQILYQRNGESSRRNWNTLFSYTGGGDNSNFQIFWTGQLTATKGSGNYGIKFQLSDDTATGYIDLNNDGVFDSAQEQWNNDTNTWQDRALVGGQTYNVAFGFREGSGNDNIQIDFRGPGLTAQIVNPSAAAQAGMWSYSVSAPAAYGNNVTVLKDSRITTETPTFRNVRADLGVLTIADGATLDLDGQITFTRTQVTGVGPREVTFNVLGAAADLGAIDTGGLPTTIVQTGPGTLELTDTAQAMGPSTTIRITGTTVVEGDEDDRATGEANFALENGSTLFVRSIIKPRPGALSATYWNANLNVLDDWSTVGLMPSAIKLEAPIDFTSDGWGPRGNNFNAQWTGFLYVPQEAAGTIQFQLMTDDQGFLSLGGTQIIYNSTNTTGNGSATLPAGLTPLVLKMREGSGSERASLRWNVGGTIVPIPAEYLWTYQPAGSVDLTGNSLSVAGSAVLDGELNVRMGLLAMADGAALSVLPSAAGSYARFVATTLDGNATLNATGTMYAGKYTDAGAPSTITKTGGGALLFDELRLAPQDADTEIDIQQGTVGVLLDGRAGPDGGALPGASFKINGGTLGLSAASTDPVTFDNPLEITSAGGRIEAGAFGANASPGPVTVTIAGSLNLPGGALQIAAMGDYGLQVTGGLTDANTMEKSGPGPVAFGGGINTAVSLTVSEGSLSAGGGINAGASLAVNGGGLTAGGSVAAGNLTTAVGTTLDVSGPTLTATDATIAGALATHGGSAEFTNLTIEGTASLDLGGGALQATNARVNGALALGAGDTVTFGSLTLGRGGMLSNDGALANLGDVRIASGGKLEIGLAGYTMNSILNDGTIEAKEGVTDLSDKLITSTANGVAGAPQSAAILSYWSMDDGNGTTAVDFVGGNDATFEGGTPTWATGVEGGAIDLDGTDDLFRASPLAQFHGGSFSVSFWAKRDTTDTEDFIFAQRKANSARQHLHIGFRNASQFAFGFYSDDLNYDTPISGDTDNWHMWTATFDATTLLQALYIDGTLVASRTAGGALNVDTAPEILLGQRGDGGTRFFDGGLDEVLVYNTALSSTDVADLFLWGGLVSGNINVDANATLKVKGFTNAGIISVDGGLELGDADSSCFDLALGGQGALKIGSGALTVEQGDLAEITAEIVRAYNGGDWSGAAGITSSLVQADPTLAIGTYQDVNGAIRIQVTVFGDADLSGTVDRDDLLAMKASFGGAGYWQNGDFNYDGVVDLLDYISYKEHYGDVFAGGGGGGIPEPATLALLAIGAAGLLFRRRRRGK